MKLTLLILTLLSIPAHYDAKITRLKARVERQEQALEASQTALLYVVTRWGSHGGTIDQPEFLLSVAALRKIEEARP